MKSRRLFLSAIGLLWVSSQVMAADERILSRQQVPNTVHSAFQKDFPSARQVGYLEEIKAGKTVYEIEFKDGGKGRSAFYTEAGRLIESEKAINSTELPDFVTTSIKNSHPKAVVKQAEQVMAPDGTIRGYEIDIAEPGEMIELVLDSSGKVINADPANAYSAPIGLPAKLKTTGQ